jgi:IS5 family transposase
VGARAFHGNLYDGHTLWHQLEQVIILMQGKAGKPVTEFVDLGYLGDPAF